MLFNTRFSNFSNNLFCNMYSRIREISYNIDKNLKMEHTENYKVYVDCDLYPTLSIDISLRFGSLRREFLLKGHQTDCIFILELF